MNAPKKTPLFTADQSGLNFLSMWFTPGFSAANVATVNFAAFGTISIITFMSFMQPYVLNEILQIPTERQGRFTGNLAAMQEVVIILLMGFFGAWSDQVGRRLVFVLGFGFLGFGYFIYPLATSESQLTLFRLIFAIGGASAPIMLSACIQDASQEVSRGKWVAFNSICTGSGVLFMALVLAKTPVWYQTLGADAATAGRFAFWTTTGFCIIIAIALWFGLKTEKRVPSAKKSLVRQVGKGIREGVRNPRLAVAYAGAFIGRGDLIIVSTFLSLWIVQYGRDHELSTATSLAKAGMLFGIVQGSAMLWAFLMGMISDRLNRLTSLCIGLLIATLGYSWMGEMDDPFAPVVIPAAVLLGMGETSVLIAAGALIGQEARPKIRGAVLGVFGLIGGVGIMFATFAGGLVFDNIGRTAPFTLMGLMNLALLLVVFVTRLRAGQPTNFSANHTDN